jgi:hypothetical protein
MTTGRKHGKRHQIRCKRSDCREYFHPTVSWHIYHSKECGDVERHRRRAKRIKLALAKMLDTQMAEAPYGT